MVWIGDITWEPYDSLVDKNHNANIEWVLFETLRRGIAKTHASLAGVIEHLATRC